MEVYNIILLFMLFSSITALNLPYEYKELKNSSYLSPIVQNTDEKCDPSLSCFEGAECSVINEENLCYCGEGTYYHEKKCKKLDKEPECNLRNFQKTCECPEGTKRFLRVCKAPIAFERCSKDCGYGVCVEKPKKTCVCFGFAAPSGDGICTLKKEICAGGLLQEDLKKCKCENQYTQAVDGVTCRLKNCSDSDVTKECKSKNAECKMDWKAEAYSCKCREGYIEDENGICKDKCWNWECSGNGECVIMNKKPTCKCKEGYEGEHCQIDKCSSRDCSGNGKCKIENYVAVCECDERYEGENCERDKCFSQHCSGKGECKIVNKKATCDCEERYEGENCEIEIIPDVKTSPSTLSVTTVSKSTIIDTKTSTTTIKTTETTNTCEADSDCMNGGTCIENGDDSRCFCLEGTSGMFCEIILNCELLNCGNDSTCVYDIEEKAAKCRCKDENKSYDMEDKQCRNNCAKDSDCKNGASCLGVNPYKSCSCLEGTQGIFCEIVPECNNMECGNEAICTYNTKEKRATCQCIDKEKTYDEKDRKCKTTCSNYFCHGHGECKIIKGKAKCYCYERYEGEFCHTDKCSKLTCQNGGECLIKDGKAVCNCTDNYTGKFCETDLSSMEDPGIYVSVRFHNKNSSMNGTKFDFHFGRKEGSNGTRTQLLLRLNSESVISTSDRKCSKITCKNGGTCVIENGKAVCNCTDKYIGNFCEKECNCQNGKCKEVSGKIECVCYPEYGKYKEGVCKACECGKGANCTFNVGTFWSQKTKTCICPESFVEAEGVCVDPDLYNPCLNNPCKNGARCEKNGVRAKCLCLPGYSGELCQHDKCSLIKCQNVGKCEIKDGKAVCICPDGYAGDFCETDRCSLIKCQNGGKCVIHNEKAFCDCDDKHIGDFCELDKCSLMKCLNGGKCEIVNQKTVCVCNDRFTGDFCEKDKCLLIRCQNGGKCYVKNGQALCNCPEKFDGHYCERKISLIRK